MSSVALLSFGLEKWTLCNQPTLKALSENRFYFWINPLKLLTYFGGASHWIARCYRMCYRIATSFFKNNCKRVSTINYHNDNRCQPLCAVGNKSIFPFCHFLHLLIDFAFNYIPSKFSLLNPFSIENSALPPREIVPTEYAPNDYQTRRRCSFANDFISKWAIFVLNLPPYSFDRHIKRGSSSGKLNRRPVTLGC